MFCFLSALLKMKKERKEEKGAFVISQSELSCPASCQTEKSILPLTRDVANKGQLQHVQTGRAPASRRSL